MLNEIVSSSTVLPESIVVTGQLKIVTNQILKLNWTVKKNLFKIALLLAKVNNEKLYEKDGFRDVYDYALQVFGYKKIATNNMLRVASQYIDETGETTLPHKTGYDFSMSQVVKMLPMGYDAAKKACEDQNITPDMSCRTIEKVVKTLSNPVLESSENEEISTITVDDDVEIENAVYEPQVVTFYDNGKIMFGYSPMNYTMFETWYKSWKIRWEP